MDLENRDTSLVHSLMVNANVHVFVNSNLLQVLLFTKNQSEKEIDEMHLNYSKWFFFFGDTHSQFVDTLEVWLIKVTAVATASTDKTVLHNCSPSVWNVYLHTAWRPSSCAKGTPEHNKWLPHVRSNPKQNRNS